MLGFSAIAMGNPDFLLADSLPRFCPHEARHCYYLCQASYGYNVGDVAEMLEMERILLMMSMVNIDAVASSLNLGCMLCNGSL